MRVGSGVAAQVEGAWPYAPVLEALADLCRRHPALLDGLDDALRKEIESGLAGRRSEWTAAERAPAAVRRRRRTAPARRGGYRRGPGRRRRPSGRRRQPAAAALPGPQHRLRAGARRAGPPARGSAGTRPGPAEPARPRHRRHPRPAARYLDEDVRPWCAPSRRTPTTTSSTACLDRVRRLPFSVVELARIGRRRARPGRRVAASRPTLHRRQAQALAAAAILGTTFDTDEFIARHGAPRGRRATPPWTRRLAADCWCGPTRATSSAMPCSGTRCWPRSAAGPAARSAPAGRGRPAGLDRLADPDRPPPDPGRRPGRAVPWVMRGGATSAALGAYREALDDAGLRPRAGHGRRPGRAAVAARRPADGRGRPGRRRRVPRGAGRVPDPAERSKLRARLARAATFAGDLDTAAVALDGLTPDGSPDDADAADGPRQPGVLPG